MFLVPKGSEIKKRRISQGLSRYALSKKAGLGSYAVARLENGTHASHILRAKALAETLSCDVSDIFEQPSNS